MRTMSVTANMLMSLKQTTSMRVPVGKKSVGLRKKIELSHLEGPNTFEEFLMGHKIVKVLLHLAWWVISYYYYSY